MPDPASESSRTPDAPRSPDPIRPTGAPGVGPSASAHEAKDRAADPGAGSGLRSLSPLGLAAGGAAAATASVVGGQLGIAGTVIGAFLTSVVSATALAIYSESVKRGKQAVVKIKDHALAHVPQGTAAGSASASEGSSAAAEDSADGDEQEQGTSSSRRRRILTIVLGALAMAAIAVVIVFGIQRFTGTELSTGTGQIQRSVSGDDAVAPASGDTGSTTPVEQPTSSGTDREDSTDTATPTDGASTRSADPSESASATPTDRSTSPAQDPTTGGSGQRDATTAPAQTGGAGDSGQNNQGAGATQGTQTGSNPQG